MASFEIDPEFEALIPPLSEEERQTLEENLKAAGGATSPLIVWDGLLLDGHNRYEICTRLGLDFDVVEAPEGIESRDDALLWIIDNQLGRRNLTKFVEIELRGRQAAILASCAMERMKSGRDPDQNSGQGLDDMGGRVDRQIAKAVDTSHATVHEARAVIAKAPEKIKAALRTGEVSIHAGYEAMRALERMSPPKRAEMLEQLNASDFHDVKKAIGEVKLAAKRQLAEDIRVNPIVTPDGRYQVIVSDPPWMYEARKEDTTHRGKNQYPDMTTEEICDLPVAALSQPDCVLWLWTTNAFMREAYACLDAWGFKAKTILTWDKERMGLGDWLRNQTEHCIFAVKGKPVVSLTNQTTILRESRREHSRKPDGFYDLVEALCPGSKLEMFSRTNREGWAAWGAETEKFDAV